MMMAAMGDSTNRSSLSMVHHHNLSKSLPLVISLNCIDDCSLEQESLSGIATVDHVSLSRLSDGRIESASAVLLHSLVFLPRAAQRRLRPWQLILCLGSSDRNVESALATDLGLHLVHVDASRAEEIADSVMALFLGLLRRTHMLMKQSLSSSGWLGYVQPLCRGMRRCRGLVLGIVGISASARSLATRSLAFKMSVLYFDVHEGKEKIGRSLTFPSAARRMDTLNDLLAASDLISLHCTLTNETVQIINAECLEHLKPGAFLVNTGSSQLLDDCAVKQLLIDGTLAGCALDGAEGPQWMEAWVREMPNVLILPRSANYSDEVWMDIREKALSVMQAFFMDGVIPKDAISDTDDDETEINYKNDRLDNKTVKESVSVTEQLCESYHQSEIIDQSKISTTPQLKSPSQNTVARSEGKRCRSGKKAKKRQARQRSKQNSDNPLFLDKESRSNLEDNTGTSSTDQVINSSEDCSDQKTRTKSLEDSDSGQTAKQSSTTSWACVLKEGCVIALHARDGSGLHVSRQRGKGGGWFLETLSNVTKRDPAAQFLVVLRQKDTIGLRSFVAGGKLLQVNRGMELVFASHSFDVWESWTIEGSCDKCRFVNRKNPMVSLDACVEVLALAGDEDGVTRWLD